MCGQKEALTSPNPKREEKSQLGLRLLKLLKLASVSVLNRGPFLVQMLESNFMECSTYVAQPFLPRTTRPLGLVGRAEKVDPASGGAQGSWMLLHSLFCYPSLPEHYPSLLVL